MEGCGITILEEAGHVVDGKMDKYGLPEDNLKNIAAMWSVILGLHVSPEEVGLCMILLKVAREAHQQKRDNLVDIAGYARCLERMT